MEGANAKDLITLQQLTSMSILDRFLIVHSISRTNQLNHPQAKRSKQRKDQSQHIKIDHSANSPFIVMTHIFQ